ncbi:MAG: M48 family metallopeptidase [Burkholderiaceae bacterium]|nr:M48 family metallopeptidase [Burkholderiaceae bacterium]
MNFFDHQQQARVATKRLVLLFALAVIGVVVAVNVAASWAWYVAGGRPDASFHLLITLGTVALIAAGTGWETMRLRSGGDAVAAMVGARAVDPGTRDLLERRLINVVEEMSLASGTPVPRVYVMDEEAGINAFAAGHSVNDAVIAVTRGTLTRLTRDELQGVIAHEFSHILNGDMRINIRLIGVLFGLMMLALAGRFMMEVGRGGRDSKGVAFVAIAGIALWLIGYIGVFFGRLIKAGVSRSREYLADASAVQFTRNPEGIGGALNFASGLLATHPPLADRIQRIYGRTMDLMLAPEQAMALAMQGEPARTPSAAEAFGRLPVLPLPGAEAATLAAAGPLGALAAAGAAPLAQSIGTTAPSAQPFADRLRERVHALGLSTAIDDSSRAQLLVLALLVDKASTVAAQQQQAITQTFGQAATDEVDRLHAAVRQLAPGERLPLLDLAMPALRKLPAAAGDALLMLSHTLILADGRMTLAEFLLFTVLKRRIGKDAQRAVPLRYRSAAELPDDASRVLSLLAHVRAPEDAAGAFDRARMALPQVELTLVPREQLALDRIAAALSRLNQLLPLAKPAFIDACARVALGGGAPADWKAASCLRSICAALDSPLPPALN